MCRCPHEERESREVAIGVGQFLNYVLKFPKVTVETVMVNYVCGMLMIGMYVLEQGQIRDFIFRKAKKLETIPMCVNP